MTPRCCVIPRSWNLRVEDDVVYKGLLSLTGVSKNDAKVLRNSSVVEVKGEDDVVYRKGHSPKSSIQK